MDVREWEEVFESFSSEDSRVEVGFGRVKPDLFDVEGSLPWWCGYIAWLWLVLSFVPDSVGDACFK